MKIYNNCGERLSLNFKWNVIPERVTLTHTETGEETTYDVLELELGGPFYPKSDFEKCSPSFLGRELKLKLGYGDTHHRSCFYTPLKNYSVTDGYHKVKYHWY